MHKYSFLNHNWLAHKLQNSGFKQLLHHIHGITLDLGCGNRPFKDDIAPVSSHNIGIDWLNSQHSIKADIVADINQPLPIRECCIDTVVFMEVLEHIPNPTTTISEIYKALKPKGKIVMSTPFQWREHEKPHDYFRYTQFGLRHILENAGFEDIIVIAKSGVWTTVCLKVNYQLVRIANGRFKLLLRLFFFPIWFITQVLAIILDKLWPGDGESIGYFVVASKP